MLSWCVPKKFLWMSLHTAGVVIGWVSAVTSLIQAMICVGVLVNFDRIIEVMRSGGPNENYIAATSTGLSVSLSVLVGVNLLDFVASMLMIIGTKMNSHVMLLPWLIHSAFVLGFKVIMNCILLFCRVSVFGLQIGSEENFIAISIALGVCLWAWNVIFALFRKIRESEDPRKNDAATLSTYKLFSITENNHVKA